MSSEWEIKMSQARVRLPLRLLMQQRGKTIPEGKKHFKCPYCQSDAGSMFHPDGARNEMFKCFSTKCPTGTCGEGCAWDEVNFLAYELGLQPADAAIAYLKEAGVWVERDRTPPSLMPGARARRHKPPTPPKPEPEKKPEPAPPEPAKEEPAEPKQCDEDEELILQCIEIVRAEAKASAALLQRRLRLGYSRAARLMDELERRGIIGPAKEGESREVLPAKPESESSEAGDVSRLEPSHVDGSASQQPAEAVPPAPPVESAKADLDDALPGQRVLEEFYSRLTLTSADEKSLFIKRGLETESSIALGFVSSPDSNRDILESLADEYTWEELQASGLWLPSDAKKKLPRRPNAQFYGLGQKGKKPKADRRNKNDRWEWGKTHPVLIPYFNESGRIIKLRPHKGGAPANTLCGASRIYVPRDFRRCADTAEIFFKVVICEGDFKASALWQTLGAGSKKFGAWSGNQIGVCGIPGINFANNFELRAELEAWLRSVQCAEVIVVFDNEDKSEKPLRERHEAYIWARYLATDLAKKLHITGKFAMLPNTWRDEKGKADWDGALANFIHKPEHEQTTE